MTSTRRSRPTRSCLDVVRPICSRRAAASPVKSPLALVDLDQRAHRHRVVRVGAQHLAVDLDGPPGVPQLLAVQLRDAPEHVDAGGGVGLRAGPRVRAGPPGGPALGLQQDAPLGLARPAVGRGQLLGPLPGGQRPLGIAELLLRDGGDLLEPRQQLVRASRRSPARARTKTRAGRPAPPSRPSHGSARRRPPARPGSRARSPAPRAGRPPPDRRRPAGPDTAPPAPA